MCLSVLRQLGRPLLHRRVQCGRHVLGCVRPTASCLLLLPPWLLLLLSLVALPVGLRLQLRLGFCEGAAHVLCP